MLRGTSHHAFPVVNSANNVVGLVPKKIVVNLLIMKAFYNKDMISDSNSSSFKIRRLDSETLRRNTIENSRPGHFDQSSAKQSCSSAQDDSSSESSLALSTQKIIPKPVIPSSISPSLPPIGEHLTTGSITSVPGALTVEKRHSSVSLNRMDSELKHDV